jgi:hypothetical protein
MEKQNIEQYVPHTKPCVNSGAPEGGTVPPSLTAPVMSCFLILQMVEYWGEIISSSFTDGWGV